MGVGQIPGQRFNVFNKLIFFYHFSTQNPTFKYIKLMVLEKSPPIIELLNVYSGSYLFSY